MANVNVKFNGKDYILSCDDGQEESLIKLTNFLDKKYSELKSKLGNIGENKLLLITAIKLIDEHFDLRQRISEQKNKLDNLSNVALNTNTSRGRIEDANFAKESARLTKAQILSQSAMAMIAQAGKAQQNVLQLLQN